MEVLKGFNDCNVNNSSTDIGEVVLVIHPHAMGEVAASVHFKFSIGQLVTTLGLHELELNEAGPLGAMDGVGVGFVPERPHVAKNL